MSVETIKLLSIEDNPGDARLIRAMLAQARSLAWDLPRFDLEWVQTLADGLARLDKGGIDVVLSDLDLPDSRAGDTFAAVHAHAPQVPIVVLTGREDEELARHTVRAGAEDYLFKREMSGPLLAHALIYAIERQQTKQALQQAHNDLERRVEQRTAELKQANQQLHHRSAELAALNVIARQVGQSLDLEEVLSTALKQTLALLEAKGGLIYLLEKDSQHFIPVAHQGLSQDVIQEVTGFQIGEGLSGRAAQKGKALIVADLANDPRNISPTAAREGWRSYAGVPIQSRDRVLGVMTLVSARTDHFKVEHAELLNRIGATAGMAIQNAQLYQTAQQEIVERKNIEEALRHSSEKGHLLLDLVPVGITITDETGNIIDANQMSEELLDISVEEHTQRRYDGPEWQIVRPDGTPMPPEEYASVRALQEQRTVRNVEMGIVKSEDQVTWISTSAAPIPLEGYGVAIAYADVSERVQAEQNWCQQKAFLETLLETIPTPIFYKDLGGWYTGCNRAFEEFVGRSREEIIGKSIYDLAPKEIADKYAEKDRELFRHPGQQRYEWKVQAPDGQIREVIFDKASILGLQGQPVGLVGAITDITERKRAEAQREAAFKALRESEARYRLMVETSSDIIFQLDLEGRITYCSPAAERALGFSPDEVVSTHLTHYFPAVGLAQAMQNFERAASAERVEVIEAEILNKAGVSVAIEANLVPIIRDEQVVGVQGIARDITEHRRTEQALRKTKERLEKIFVSQRDALFVLDAEMPPKILDCNPAASKTFGYSRERMLGQNTAFLHVDEASLTKFQKHLYPSIARQGFLHLPEFKMRRKDGAIFPTEHTVVPLEDEQGERIGWLSVVRDITERVQAKEMLKQHAAKLERSNQELEQFAHIVSHDLRAPLRTVKGYLELVQQRSQGQLDAETDKFIGRAVDEATRMQEMIQALLGLARVHTQGREFASVNCKALLERTLATYKIDIEQTGAQVSHDPLPTVLADEAQLAQVFQNLVDNALKYRSEEPPQIHVSARREGDEWLFSVQDNGIGIDPAQAERTFQIFQRLHTQDEYEGTGIGLAIGKKIIERHGGRIWVESEPGQGSTFYFTLPARETGF